MSSCLLITCQYSGGALWASPQCRVLDEGVQGSAVLKAERASPAPPHTLQTLSVLYSTEYTKQPSVPQHYLRAALAKTTHLRKSETVCIRQLV